jgi:hypothetical protein
MLTTPVNCLFANCSCPSWNASTDESALRRALASLDDCGTSLHSGLKVATALVVVGVALEMVFVIWEYLEDLHDFKRGIIHPPDKPSRLLFALGFLGAALVSLGVAGELYAESKIATLETCIRKGNDALSLLLSKEAGDAMLSAQVALGAERVAEQKLEDIFARAEKMNASLLRLRRFVDWRTLSPKQKDRIRDGLSPWAGQLFTSATYQDDPECVNLLNDLFETLLAKEPRWRYVPQSGFLGNGLETGVILRLPPSADSFVQGAANKLASLLNAEGIATQVLSSGIASKGTTLPRIIQIIVGKRPKP